MDQRKYEIENGLCVEAETSRLLFTLDGVSKRVEGKIHAFMSQHKSNGEFYVYTCASMKTLNEGVSRVEKFFGIRRIKA